VVSSTSGKSLAVGTADLLNWWSFVATPTSSTVGVTRLAGPDFMIEMEAVAVVNS